MPDGSEQQWPPAVAPMLATARPAPPSGAGYGWEWKYDGARAIARIRPDGAVRLDSRNARDFTASFPEITAALGEALPNRRLTIDGELVAMSPVTGAPDFAQLQQRLGTAPSAELLARVPVSYVVFDLLHLDDTLTLDLPYTERRRLLTELGIAHPRLLVPGHLTDVDPATLLELAGRHHVEGMVGKRLDSPYRPGRNLAWVKTAIRHRMDLVIGGWNPGHGNRHQHLGSLLLGRPTPAAGGEPAGLVFMGAVGTGWSVPFARRLLDQLRDLQQPESPFNTVLPREYVRDARWVRPELVAEIDYRTWTPAGYLRHPSFKGLRRDKSATDLVEPGGGQQ